MIVPNVASQSRMVLTLIDDEADLVDVLAETMGDTFEVESFTDVNSAIQLIAREPKARIILCDVIMPGGSGHDFVRRLRNLGDNSPVVLMTANSDMHEFIWAPDLAVSAIVEKPFEADFLRGRLVQIARHYLQNLLRECFFECGEGLLDQYRCSFVNGKKTPPPHESLKQWISEQWRPADFCLNLEVFLQRAEPLMKLEQDLDR